MNDYDEIVEDELLEGDEGFEDNPLYEALNDDPTSGKDADDDDEELDEFEPQDGDSGEVLRTKLAAKNRILRQRAKTNSRLKDRVEELEAKLNAGSNGMSKDDIAELINAVKGGNDNSEEDEQAKIEALKERLEEDPTAIVEILGQSTQSLENKLANILQSRDAYWEEKLNKITNQRAQEENPEVMRIVGILRQKPQYQDTDEATLIQFAKDLSPLGKRVKRPPATTSARSAVPFDAGNDVVEKKYASELDRMGYGSEND